MYQSTVLIVEDEPLIRMMLADVLVDEGYRVVEAGHAMAAIAVLAAQDIDAVITDIDMPGALGGLDLAQHISACRRRLPVIVTSGGHKISAAELPGLARFIPKPYEPERILRTLLELMAPQPANATSFREVGAA
ncbi:response regulator [Rhizobium sp. RU36D]|uniref:response regulator n=1 Tax=Rhizobium sp. RU36D TaxID=1907415 RepID=UPI0009D79D0C|nr:response regulator [Rhizobium sp. RU36D]SMC94837.1 Response regulator receiver domain-containing protein [Rhizobium sp. RU36D]